MQNLEADVGRRHRLPHITWHSREANRRDFYKYSLNIPTFPVMHLYNSQVYALSHATQELSHSNTLFVQTNMFIKLTGTTASSTVGEIKRLYKPVSLLFGERGKDFPKCVLHLQCCQVRVLQACTNVWIHYSPCSLFNKKLFHCCEKKMCVLLTAESH